MLYKLPKAWYNKQYQNKSLWKSKVNIFIKYYRENSKAESYLYKIYWNFTLEVLLW